MTSLERHAVIVDSAGDVPPSLPGGSLVVRRGGRSRAWTACVPVPEDGAQSIADGMVDVIAHPSRIAIARVQPGLDMWRPLRPARARVGIVEYVTSAAEARADYYRSQYTTSGPAMRELWEQGWVQRFVGFEIVCDVMAAPGSGWDVLHVNELALSALPRMAFWARRFDVHARRAGYADMRTLKRRWSDQRTIDKRRASVEEIGASSARAL